MATVTATIEFHNGTTWANITADVISKSLHWRGGIKGSGPTDRVAVPGQLDLELKNGQSASGGLGYYSPDHSNKRTGWMLGARIRVKLVSGANTRYWMYRVKDIRPIAGKYNERLVGVTAMDYMEEFSKRMTSGLTIQQDQRGDELLTTLVASMPIAPVNTDYATGAFPFAYSFHDERDEETSCITVLQKISQSELSYVFIDGDATDGETLTYQTHLTRPAAAVASGTLNDTMVGLEVIHGQDTIYNKIKATTYPVEIGTAVEVLGSVPEEFALEPSETKTIFIRYVDDQTARRISGSDVVTPEADTDYKMSSIQNNDANDLNADLTITATAGGNTLEAELENTNSTQKGYVNLLQVRGYKVTLYDKIENVKSDSTSITAYGEKTLTYNMPYQNNANFGDAAATELLRRHKDPLTSVSGVTFIANKSTTLMGYALTHGIGTRETITETVTGVDNDFHINGYEYELMAGNNLKVTWILERAWNETPYFTIDDATYGEIDGPYLIAPF